MNLLNRLEKKFGNFYIRNLMLIIIAGNLLVYLFTMIKGNFLINRLVLDSNKILQGEIWRLITFIFIPPVTSPLFFYLPYIFTT